MRTAASTPFPRSVGWVERSDTHHHRFDTDLRIDSLLRHPLVHAVFAFLICAFAHGAPLPDTAFGDNGSVRIGVPTGSEDTAFASAMQTDGKLIVAGTSVGRQTYAFVTRFTTNGAPDAGFGTNGTALFPPPPGYFWMTPIQIETHADGSLIVVGILYNGFVLARFSAAGALDAGFGSGGIVVVTDTAAFSGNDTVGAIRLATQPDGKLLVVTDASANGNFALRFRRFLPQGTLDSSFGANGERLLTNLPPNFAFASSNLAVAEPAGFTLAANATFAGGTYLLLRVTGNGALDPAFGGIGYVSGFDLGNPHDVPTQLARAVNNRYALFGFPASADGSRLADDVLWNVDANGASVAAFGSSGRLLLAGDFAILRTLVPLPDGGLAAAQSLGDGNVRVSRFDVNGSPVAQFGSSGSITIAAAGYLAFLPVGIHADSTGRIALAGSGYTQIGISGPSGIRKGYDVLLAGLSPSGALRTDFGSGDGIAAWDNPVFSNDRIHALRFDASNRAVLIGYSNGSGANDYLLSRLNTDGSLDTGYGNIGRLNPQQIARFTGIPRAVQQPNGSMVVVGGEAFGSFGFVRAVTVFRATAGGTLDSGFNRSFLPAGPNATVGLGVRPDGRLLYATNDPAGFDILQQFLPDGNPDPGFGTNGRVSFAAVVLNNAAQADLVLLGDGTVVFAMFSSESVRFYKVDASGVPVQGFGTGGQLVYPTADLTHSFVTAPTLLALADGTLLAAHGVARTAPSSPPQQSLATLRVSADGRLISASELLPADAGLTWVLTALPDSSVIIARNGGGGTAPPVALYRLLPDNQFDAAFGAGGAYALAGFANVSALGIDLNGELLVAGQDPTSALLARYRLNAAVAGVSVVEYFNVNLGHYFITANAAEMASIESGGAGPGWQRTGFGFFAYVPEAGVAVGARPVCRFYGTPGVGPNSHFYTADAAECAAVKRDPGWTYEGTAFYALPVNNSQCDGASPPVFRAYNNRYAQNDSNHRYATDPSLLQALLPQGWIMEGTVFCAAPG